MQNNIVKHALKTALVMIVFGVAGTFILAITNENTKAPIAQSEALARMDLFRQILPENLHDNDLLKDTIQIAPSDLLGDVDLTVHRARINHQPAAVILESVAPDGYSGNIKLLIAVKYDGSLSGVRVLAHKETPGLGDYIEIARDTWIKQFDHQSLLTKNEKDWQVKKDGGTFDYMAGATITPRAVVKAVHKALQYYAENKDKLFSENLKVGKSGVSHE